MMRLGFLIATICTLLSSSIRSEVLYLHIDCKSSEIKNEGTKDVISVSLWQNDFLLDVTSTSSHDAIQRTGSPLCGESNNKCQYVLGYSGGDNPTHIIIQTNGDDGFFIDRVWLSKPNEKKINYWGANEKKGWCLSLDSDDANGTWDGYLAKNACFPALKLMINEPQKWEGIDAVPKAYIKAKFKVIIDCFGNDMENESTKDKISIRFYNGDQFLKGFETSDLNCGALKNTVFELDGKVSNFSHFLISTNGDDAFWMDRVIVKMALFDGQKNEYKAFTKLQQFGKDNGNGWCLSTDPEDGNRSWKDRVSGCWETVKFNLETGKVSKNN